MSDTPGSDNPPNQQPSSGDPLYPTPQQGIPTPSPDVARTQANPLQPNNNQPPAQWPPAPGQGDTGPIRAVRPDQQYPGQQYPGQGYPGEGFSAQQYPGQPNPGQPNPTQYPGQPYSGTVPTNPAPTKPGRNRLILIIAAAVVAVVAVAAVVFWMVNREDVTPVSAEAPTTAVTSSAPSETIAAPQVSLEPAGTPGDDPFLDTVTPTEIAEFPDAVVAVIGDQAAKMPTDKNFGTLTSAGVEPALYGGSRDNTVCDVAALADFLAADDAKATAWAFARGISKDQIGAYLTTLTPVILLHDTALTNFGFADGAAAPRQSILQAGSAVLIDATGAPVVRCACGNPLAAPVPADLTEAEFTGEEWDSFDVERVVVVTPGIAVEELTLVDIVTGELYQQPVGSAPPVAETTAPPSSAAAEVSCEFQTLRGETAWVDPAISALTCAERIAKWQEYENWTGELAGQLQIATFPDGSTCNSSYFPPTADGEASDNGSIGSCSLANGVQFDVWRGTLGQKLTQTGTDRSGGSAGTTPAPEGGGAGACVDNGDTFTVTETSSTPPTCADIVQVWRTFEASGYAADATRNWSCYIGSGDDVTFGCVRIDAPDAFEVILAENSGSAPGDGGAGDGGAGAGGAAPGGAFDLGLSVPISSPACDGRGIVFLGAGVTPGAYESDIQNLLNTYPDASYLRTDQSCKSLRQQTDAGNPIYAVYRLAGYDQASVCAGVYAAPGSYGKLLDNTTDPGYIVPC